MNQNKITELLNHEPYSCLMKSYEYADILYENEGLMTVPKNSANTIVDLLNKAYKCGVKSTIKLYSIDYSGCTYSSSEGPMGLQGPMSPQGPMGPQGQMGQSPQSFNSQQIEEKQINNFKSKKLFK
jgi:hypothetical protein